MSLLDIASLKDKLGHPWAEVMEAYMKAYDLKGHVRRTEPLLNIAEGLIDRGQFRIAHLFADTAEKIPKPQSVSAAVCFRDDRAC